MSPYTTTAYTTSSSSCFVVVVLLLHLLVSPSEELWTQTFKSHLLRTQSLKVLPLKPGVGQYIALHATLIARDFFLANSPEGRPGMSDVSLQSGISGLSFDSTLLSPLLFSA